ncbi:hypothetical protein WJU23_18185 [Prosthecobacter sp. SYSU 5D2]|uniref:hypothetical protein n=1 Tax=Prosthecobacter sp. SYSU 5D2 TaxID=3134134 RepID=UPI0031FF35C4
MSATSPSSPMTQFTKAALVALTLLFVGLKTSLLAQADTLPKDSPFFTKEGPWGRLQCYYFYLEAPDSVVSRTPTPDTQTRWRIPEAELTAFENLISLTELPDELVSALFNPRNIIRRSGTANLFPSARLIESLSAKDRKQVYETLARYPSNEYYEYPIVFAGGSVEAWARDSGLRQELVAAISLLSYQRGEALAFSDIPVLLGLAESNAEALFIKKKLTRTRTIIARLEVNKDSPVQDMLDYWATGLNLRRKELEPLFQATAAAPGIGHIDLLHMLPALPRKLIYTYPSDEFTTHIRFPDCHWTTLNFFNFTAQDYYLDSHLASSAVIEDFQQVSPPFRFGDVLMFINASGNAFHSCIYVADDLVYTKNGANPLVPWTLMELKDMHSMYNLDLGKGVILGYRHKEGRLEPADVPPVTAPVSPSSRNASR